VEIPPSFPVNGNQVNGNQVSANQVNGLYSNFPLSSSTRLLSNDSEYQMVKDRDNCRIKENLVLSHARATQASTDKPFHSSASVSQY
jgi:hypothetical protein